MDKEKVLQIFKETESLTAAERAFLAKKLTKSILRDIEYKDRVMLNFSSMLESSTECIKRLTKEIEQYEAKEAFNTLKKAEQKLKENGSLGVCYLVDNETNEPVEKSDMRGIGEIKNKDKAATKEHLYGTITAKTAFKNLNKPPQ